MSKNPGHGFQIFKSILPPDGGLNSQSQSWLPAAQRLPGLEKVEAGPELVNQTWFQTEAWKVDRPEYSNAPMPHDGYAMQVIIKAWFDNGSNKKRICRSNTPRQCSPRQAVPGNGLETLTE